ncbi:Pyrokinin-1 receptor [Frankliniella fusca]|uniref:Pyrokinin-1 receptor n=1 Tax=Frankliniella fusca TaxID=407009 RepID=A0AAE1HQ81_9NEOP|nr:Pyrokinin-1 receptor [Frankliniella fusca]
MCWAPFHAQRLIAVYVDPGSTPEEEERFATMFNIVTYISGVLYFMSTMINPILYHSMSNKFKEAFWDTIYRDFHGFNCITIPEHWKKKQESRYNTRRGQQDCSRRNGTSTGDQQGGQQASRRRRNSSSMFELQPLGSTSAAATATATTSAVVSADAQSSLSSRMGRSAVVDVNKLHNGLYLNGGRSASGLPPLLRSQSMYSATPVERQRPGPGRRTRTVGVLDDTAVRTQVSARATLLLGRRSEAVLGVLGLAVGEDGGGGPRASLRLELPPGAAPGRRRAKDALDPSALDAIVPYPCTPPGSAPSRSPPGSPPPSPQYIPLRSPGATPPSPMSPPYLPPRIVELYLKNEPVPAPGWV